MSEFLEMYCKKFSELPIIDIRTKAIEDVETDDRSEDQRTTIKDLKQFVGGHSDQRENVRNQKYKTIAFDFCQAHPRVYKNPGKIEELIKKLAINGSLWQ